MSRVGKKPIPIPEKTEVAIRDGVVTVKGPLGELTRKFEKEIAISVSNGEVALAPVRETLASRALWGTYASHIKNMIRGVNESFQKKLVIEGIGYRAELSGGSIILHVGFSHTVKVPVPEGVKVSIEKNVVAISGSNKELVGSFAAYVRSVKKPEPYKGKGIRYDGEVVRRKQGKRAA